MEIVDPTGWGLLEYTRFFAPKVLVAVVCGGLVGMERQLKHKSAGIKTNTLICVGSALYSGLSVILAEASAARGITADPARLAAQIVSGIGFLGGGAIIQARGTVLGLTTAATIWVVAGIGIMIGIGQYAIAVGISGAVILTLIAMTFFENRILGRTRVFTCEVSGTGELGDARKSVYQAMEENELSLMDFSSGREDDALWVSLTYRGHPADHKAFLLWLWGKDWVREVKQQ